MKLKSDLSTRPPAGDAKTRAYRADMAVQFIHCVGPQRAKLLGRLGLETVSDLLRHYPRDWQDRRHFSRVHQLVPGTMATVMGTVKARSTFRLRRGLTMTKIMLDDGTGFLAGTWFNQPYMRDRFSEGQRVLFYGKAEFYRGWQMANPDFELFETAEEDFIHLGRIVPVYPATEGLSQRVLRAVIYEALAHIPAKLPEIFSSEDVRALGFAPPGEALRQIHFPESEAARDRARQRLIFEELFLQQLAVVRQKQLYRLEPGQAFVVAGEKVRNFRQHLPFVLTGAQERAWTQIATDLGQARPMHRLLQGDVGSGKTVVAGMALCAAVDSGCQAALMAPTEVLATQHYFTLQKLLNPLGIVVELFTSGTKAKERREQAQRLAEGTIQVAVGTHALLEEHVVFARLGMAIIDEQHRFGVEQRARLRAKGAEPHVLVMTATPIPRTLALTVFGDLDVTTVDELPPGRVPVQTQCLSRGASRQAFAAVEQEVAAGRQAYLVFPIIEESEKLNLKSLLKEFEHLHEVFPHIRLGLLHGRLPREEKDAVMSAFKQGEIQVLAATTVIEVGVDVPNATVMLIENGDRFGLAQLHQLRGRVGRGREASFCFILADPKTEEGKRRMEIIARVGDGFKLAEEDLALRGPGEFFGLRQHGLPDLKLADLIRDADQIEPARALAGRILEKDPELSAPEHRNLKIVFTAVYGQRERLSRSG
ncbi:MAG: ATP-dependent DNA helicase RecG [Candidatus Firestonebacteria bacterium]|nr:ATP-dependent DNA helicase RecG [Candidatus Firestonebacteria bacterium]